MVNEVTIKISATDNFSTVLSKYNKAVKGAGDATDEAGRKSKTAKDKFSDMGGAVQGLFGAAIIQQFGQAVGQLNAIGIEANKAKGVFSQLTAEMGGYDNVLSRLRTTTGGVVSDTLLMQSSNKLLLSGLAGNEDELNNIIELSTKLGSAMGEDAASSIENFSLMLLNQSIPRLDSFGISGSKVREEINELIQSGRAANREEAFKMAVFEQGALAIEKLGSAADIGVTAMAKLETRIGNVVTRLGEITNEGLEAGAQLLEIGVIAAEMAREGGGQGFMEVVTATVNAVVSEHTGARIEKIDELNSKKAIVGSVDTGRSIIERNREIAASYQETQAAVSRYNADALESMNMINDFAGNIDSATEASRRHDQAMNRLVKASGVPQLISGFQEAWDRGEKAMDRNAEKMQRLTYLAKNGYQGALDGIDATWQRILDNTATRNNALDIFEGGASGFQSAFDNLSQTTISGNGITFFNPGEVADLENDLAFVNEQVDRLTELNEQGIIGDDELANAKELANQFGIMARDAREAARSIEDLSLSELFGQGDGGQLAEAGRVIEGMIEDADVAGAFNDAFGLASGAETNVSQAFESNIAPALAAIAETQGAEAATHYLEAYLGAIREGQTSGLDQGELVGAGQGAVPGSVDAEGNFVPMSIFPQPEGEGQGFGSGMFGTAEGMGLEGFSTLTEAIDGAKMAVDSLSATDVEVDTDAAQENVDALEQRLQYIVNTQWKILVDVEYNAPAPPGVSGGGGGGVGGEVRSNGGNVPGEDNRTGRFPIG